MTPLPINSISDWKGRDNEIMKLYLLNQKVLNQTLHWPVWVNGWVFVYEVSGCGFESSCSHLNFKCCACFEHRVPLHSGNYKVWIHSKMHTWHDKNIQPSSLCR